MRAAVLEGPGRVTVRDVLDPVVEAGTALVRVRRAGLCGTDLKLVDGAIAVDHPRVLGHEVVGEVVSAERIAVGTRVLVDPSASCGACRSCRSDQPHLCASGGLLGRDVDGGLAEFLAVAEDALHPLPDVIPDAAASLLQVLSTCVHGQDLVPAPLGGTAAVLGLGVGGLLHLQLLRARGMCVVAADPSPVKRALALELGASAAVTPGDLAAAVDRATVGRGADLSVECVGTAATLGQAIELAAPAATVLAFGVIAPHADSVPTYECYLKELTLLVPRAARPRDLDTAIALAPSLELGSLVSATLPLEEVGEGLARARRPDTLKVVLEPAVSSR